MTTERNFLAAFWVLFGSMLVLRTYLAMRGGGAGRGENRAGVAREGGWWLAARVALVFAFLAWVIVCIANPSLLDRLALPFPGWLRWCGFVLGLAGVGGAVWAQATLGPEWSPKLRLREGHRLVTTGPYARIRHPFYTATIGYAAGLALVTENLAIVVIAVVATGVMILRAPWEERMMMEGFGEEYRSYLRRTGRFLPQGRRGAEH
jgi:protein-S-isoprenylcysteine O-methyltransferase Ste14